MADEVEEGDFGGAFDSYLDDSGGDSGGSSSDDGGSSSDDTSTDTTTDTSTDTSTSSSDTTEVEEGDFDGAFDEYVDNRDDDTTTEPTQEQEQLLDGSTGDTSGSETDDTDTTTEPTQEQDQLLDGSTGSTDTDDTGTTTDPTQEQDQALDGSTGDTTDDADVPTGNTPDSGNLPSDDGSTPETGQGIGPDGVSGSEAATPDSETDAPTNDSTQDIDATQTGALEDTATGQTGERARAIEQQVTGTQIGELSDDLALSGAELREQDVMVVRDDGQLQAQLSPVGRERVQNISDRQQEELIERQIEDNLNQAFGEDDVSVDDGDVEVSDEVREAAREQQTTDSGPTQSNPGAGVVGGGTVSDTRQDPGDPSEEFVEEDPEEIPSDPFLARDTRATIRGGANEVANTLVGTNDPDRDVTDSLTAGDEAGFLTESEERDVRQDIRQRNRAFNFGNEAAGVVRRLTGSETATGAARGIGRLPGQLAGATAGATLLADIAAESAENAPETIESEGLVDTGAAIVNQGTTTTRRTVDTFRENPAEQGALLLGEALVGTAALRGASRTTQAASNIRTRAAADATVDFEDITSERGQEGLSPTFDTSESAPTREAVDEIETRAADQPDDVQEAVGSDRVLFRSESERLPEDLEAQEGNFELPGLFASPDASPLRTDLDSGRSLSDITPRLPRASDFTPTTQRLSAFEGDRVEGIPQEGAGSGFAVRDPDGEIVETFGPDQGREARAVAEAVDGERVPDPDAAGSQFLRSDAADEGTAFVRATGDRTSELEAIFPQGSEFQRRRQLAVNLPNRETATLDVFERRNAPEADGVDTDAADAAAARVADTDSDDVLAPSDIRRLERRATTRPDGQPVTPGVGVSGSTSPTVRGSSDTASGFDTSPVSESGTTTGTTTTSGLFSGVSGLTSAPSATGLSALGSSTGAFSGGGSSDFDSFGTTGGGGSGDGTPAPSSPGGGPSGGSSTGPSGGSGGSGTSSGPSGGPGSPFGPGPGGNNSPDLDLPEFDDEDGPDDALDLGVSDEVFETGVVQSLDDL